MNSDVKSMSTNPGDSSRTNLYRVAIVGAASIKGKEIAEVLNDRNFPSLEIKLLDDDEALGRLETVGDEVSFIQKIRAEQFEKVDFTFFASDQESTRKSWKAARDAGSTIVDLSYALEDAPGAVIRSPWLERQLGVVPTPELQPSPSVVAHPAAVVLALLLQRIQKAESIEAANATVFEPASEHGQPGMDELHEQTVNLLSFQQLPKSIFDTQVAFNLVTSFGTQATPPLTSIEARILKHYGKIAGLDVIVPSLLLVQAPIFHGHVFAIHLQTKNAVDVAQAAKALAGEHVNVTKRGEDSPSNVNAAGQGDILVSVLPDANHPKGLWLWAASDNLRIAASTAVECAETTAAMRPSGKIQ